MNPLSRYILRLWTQPAILFLLGTLGILLLGRMLHALEYVAEKGLSWSWLGLLALSILPYFLVLAVPLAGYAGLVATIVSMQERSEWSAALALGHSPWRMLRPVFTVFALLWIVLTWTSLVWAPAGAQAAQAILQKLRTTGTLVVAPQRFNTELGPFVLYAERTRADGTMQGVLVEDRRHSRRLAVIWAREARMSFTGPDLVLAFAEGARLEREQGTERIVEFEHYQMRMEGVLGQGLSLPAPSTASPFRLWRHAAAGDGRARVELVRRLALPLLTPAFAILAPLVALRRTRTLSGIVHVRALLAALVLENAMLALHRAAERQGIWTWMPLLAGVTTTMLLAWLLHRRLARPG